MLKPCPQTKAWTNKTIQLYRPLNADIKQSVAPASTVIMKIIRDSRAAAPTKIAQQCHKYFLQYSKFASERSQVRT